MATKKKPAKKASKKRTTKKAAAPKKRTVKVVGKPVRGGPLLRGRVRATVIEERPDGSVYLRQIGGGALSETRKAAFRTLVGKGKKK